MTPSIWAAPHGTMFGHAVLTDPPHRRSEHKPAAVANGVAAWLHSQGGFPRPLDVSKVSDKVGGAEPRRQTSVLPHARIRARLSRQQVAAEVGCSESSIETWEEGRARAAGLSLQFIVTSDPFRAKLADLLGYGADERRVAGVLPDRRDDGSVIDGPAVGLRHSGKRYHGPATGAAAQWQGSGTALKPAMK